MFWVAVTGLDINKSFRTSNKMPAAEVDEKTRVYNVGLQARKPTKIQFWPVVKAFTTVVCYTFLVVCLIF